jgi:hypothetical protein
MTVRWLPPAVAAVLLSACVVSPPAGPPRHETRVIERDAAERVRVSLHMGAGTLRVSGGSTKLMEAAFDFSEPLRPDVRYRSTGAFSDLTIEEPSGNVPLNRGGETWDLRFTDAVPVDFKVQFGAGEGSLDLGSLDLRNLDVEIGAGRMEVDLRGTPRRDYGVRIRGGVGEATVRLPHDAGIYAEASGGLGQVNVRGLHRENGYWVNDAYRSTAPKIRVDIQGGVGQINILAD